MDPDVREALDALERRLAQELASKIEASAAETRADLEQTIEASAAETRRHTGVLAEGLRSDFRLATELLSPLARRVGDLEAARDAVNQRVDVLDARVSALERIERARKPRRR